MIRRRKTPRRLTMAALSLAAALALPAAPAVAQMGDAQPAEEELREDPDRDPRGHPIWCWLWHWLLPCGTR